ncbi:diacylglycerol kinase family lipid kinase [Duganella sp. sic0402]|uniref:diacylglycerol/lipid kinase family protein n=1 Tax=Duganella sp. sic0402 TaxID=2854786 RepID=UPI001C496F4C|nr:diacylglycerol kinase family protein [Duganella sp. sic0402]MBV7536475.1 diacylglycerol kinase family lipid kinase [Duganella sp. sic0402]
MDKIVVIVNASAGLGYCGGWTAALQEKFRAHGAEADITLAKSGDEMIARAERAVAEGAPVVVAGGGDGTINAVASVLAGTASRLGVLPLGTLNHFAKDLKIPLELDDAVANVVRGVARQVDVGEVNGRIFLNNSSLGIYPDIVRDREQQQRHLGRSKWPAFGRALFAALRRFPFLSVRLKINGEEHLRRTPFVFIGNNEYLQGLTLGGRERLDSGKLCLYVAQKPTRLGLLRYALHALFGKLREARDFDVLSASALEIDTRHHHIRVATDGEVTLMKPPLCYRSRAAALNVIAPAA